MRIYSGRFFSFCILCILLQSILASPVVSQESKPDEGAEKKVFRAGVDGIGTPICIHCPPPKYSDRARADKLQGSVLLDVVVTFEGKVARIILVKGLGEGLDEKAVEAVKSWKFKPAMDNAGNPVAVLVPIQVTFRLRD